MFSAAYAALLRPLPFSDPDRLVLLFTTRTSPRGGLETFRWSRPLIETLTASVTSYQALASFTPSLVSLSGGAGDPEQIDAEIVSPGYFGLLRVSPAFGRTFTPAEDGAAGDAPVTVLSDALWRRRYGGEPSIYRRPGPHQRRPVDGGRHHAAGIRRPERQVGDWDTAHDGAAIDLRGVPDHPAALHRRGRPSPGWGDSRARQRGARRRERRIPDGG